MMGAAQEGHHCCYPALTCLWRHNSLDAIRGWTAATLKLVPHAESIILSMHFEACLLQCSFACQVFDYTPNQSGHGIVGDHHCLENLSARFQILSNHL